MKRATALVAAFGLSTGLGLGVTGIASAVDSPKPGPSVRADHRPGPPGHAFGHRAGKALRHGGGLVTKLTSDSLTVVGPRGERTIALDGKTTYFAGKEATTRAALRVGALVAVKLVDKDAAKPVAERVTVLPAHIEGIVTKVGGGTLTVTDLSGFTRVIKGTSTAAVGDFVVAVGTVDEDGTTLDATRIQVGFGKKRD